MHCNASLLFIFPKRMRLSLSTTAYVLSKNRNFPAILGLMIPLEHTKLSARLEYRNYEQDIKARILRCLSMINMCNNTYITNI